MDEKEINPTTTQHDKQANALMLALGFEWNTDERAWMPPEEPVLQSEVTDAIKKLFN